MFWCHSCFTQLLVFDASIPKHPQGPSEVQGRPGRVGVQLRQGGAQLRVLLLRLARFQVTSGIWGSGYRFCDTDPHLDMDIDIVAKGVDIDEIRMQIWI